MGVPSGEQERKGDSREGQGVGRRCDAPRGAALEASISIEPFGPANEKGDIENFPI